MPLQAPNLDDRTFDDLVGERERASPATAPEWTDLSPGDPGITLLEVFAYLAETMIYRLNRVPDKLYVEFLRLIGVRLQPPAAAAVTLVFTRGPRHAAGEIEIPRGTRVTTAARADGRRTARVRDDGARVLAGGEESVDVRRCTPSRSRRSRAGKASGAPGSWS